MRVEYAKDCKCRASATWGAVRTTTDYDEHACQSRVTVKWHPMPSCDACGKAWRLCAPEARKPSHPETGATMTTEPPKP